MPKNPLPTVSEQLRTILAGCGTTRYRLWKLTGISQPALSRFATGRGGLSLEAIDKLGQVLGLRLTMAPPPKKPPKAR